MCSTVVKMIIGKWMMMEWQDGRTERRNRLIIYAWAISWQQLIKNDMKCLTRWLHKKSKQNWANSVLWIDKIVCLKVTIVCPHYLLNNDCNFALISLKNNIVIRPINRLKKDISKPMLTIDQSDVNMQNNC